MALEALQDAIAFGQDRTIKTFEALYAAASSRNEGDAFVARLQVGDLAWAIDQLVPVVDGKRTLSQDFDSESLKHQPSQGKTPTVILANLEVAAWQLNPDERVRSART